MRGWMWSWLFMSAAAGAAAAQTGGGAATATGVSREFNPAISVNGLFLAAGFPGRADSTVATPFDSGLLLQEAELQFTAAIDPYAKADLVFSFADGKFDIEEAIVSSTVLSHGIGLRAGRMFVPIGHENTLHTHQLPFIARSLVGRAVLGKENLGEFGVEADYVPALPFFFEVRGAVYNGDDAALFAAPGDWDLAYAGGLDALWDVSEGGTLALGADYCGGPNAAGTVGDPTWTHLAAGVVRYKWRSPTRSRERALELLLEYLYGERDAHLPQDRSLQRGIYGDAKMQFARRWWVQGRYDYLPAAEVGGVDVADAATQSGSLLLAFVPSEFSAVRLQGSVVDAPADTYGEVYLQFDFTIGSHPAHKY